MPSSLMAPVASRAIEPLSWIASTAATILASVSSSKGSPFRAAWPRRTIDITPAICFPPITAILALGHRNVKRLLKARPDIA
jgi:hypothetical protein